jgi:hypothetical protein
MCVGEALGAVEAVVALDAVVKGVDMSAEGELRAESLVAGGKGTG